MCHLPNTAVLYPPSSFNCFTKDVWCDDSGSAYVSTFVFAEKRPVRIEERVGEQKGCAHVLLNDMPCFARSSSTGVEAGCPLIACAFGWLCPCGPYCSASLSM